LASVPTVTSVSPNGASTGGGTVVTVTGSNFTGATDVVCAHGLRLPETAGIPMSAA
jgi:hypothetical protein